MLFLLFIFILLSTLSHHCKVVLEILSKSLDLFCPSFKIQFLCDAVLICYRMTRMNFRFPYADQFVERYEKTFRLLCATVAANRAKRLLVCFYWELSNKWVLSNTPMYTIYSRNVYSNYIATTFLRLKSKAVRSSTQLFSCILNYYYYSFSFNDHAFVFVHVFFCFFCFSKWLT